MLISYLLQLVPPFKGKIRIGRFLIKKLLDFKNPRILSLKNGLKFSVPSLVDSIGYELFINGIYEKSLIDYLIASIPPGGIFLDVGANIGSISIFVGNLRPDVNIYAFEASPHIFSHLIKNADLNKVNRITCINKAVHHTDNLFMDFFAPKDQFGKGSFADNYTSVSEKVETMRLDGFLLKNDISPDVIKIDVQGFELYVLEGLRNYLLEVSIKPIILFDFEAWAEKIAIGEENIGKAYQLLEDYGYEVFEFEKDSKQGSGKKTNDTRKLLAFSRVN